MSDFVTASLCWYDPAYMYYGDSIHDDDDPPSPRMKGCACDNCFYGRDRLALEILRLRATGEVDKASAPGCECGVPMEPDGFVGSSLVCSAGCIDSRAALAGGADFRCHMADEYNRRCDRPCGHPRCEQGIARAARCDCGARTAGTAKEGP